MAKHTTKKTAKKPRNYRATDATLINVRAQKKRLDALTMRVVQLESVVFGMKSR